MNFSHWSVARAGWVPNLQPIILQERINAKKLLLPSYCKEVDEDWLLIFANQTNPSQMFTAPKDLNNIKFNSPFSKTFLYLYPENKVHELTTEEKL